MKMVKKVLMGLAVIAMAFSFVGCIPQVDDSEGAISGSNGKYSINYKNESTSDKYRAYKSTAMDHAGALVKVTFNDTDCGTSKMGVIFDLHDVDKKDESKGKDFYIIGLGANRTGHNFYVSKFTNVTDLQAINFGAPDPESSNYKAPAAGEPKEECIVGLTKGADLTLPALEDGKLSMYVYFKAFKDGYYEYAVLTMSDNTAKGIKKLDDFSLSALPAGVTKLYGNKIEGAFTAVKDDKSVPQNKIAVYAMVQPNETLDGSWNFAADYLEAEDAE